MRPINVKRAAAAAAAVLLAATLLAACAPAQRPVAPSPAPAPAVAPAASTAAADPFLELFRGRAAGPVLRIADDALIAVTVRRGGPLARLGHDHVVAARRIDGHAAPQAGLAALRFQLQDMTVDEAALRQHAGLTTQPSVDAIEGTRRNMLTKVLDAERFPTVEVRARRVPGDAGSMDADITLHGVTRRERIAVTVDGTVPHVVARGAFALKQTDFGIVPFAVLGGAMAVQDTLEIRFELPLSPSALR